MSKSLKRLLRLRKEKLNQHMAKVAKMQAQKNELEGQKSDLYRSLVTEFDHAQKDFFMMQTYTSYADATNLKIHKLQDELYKTKVRLKNEQLQQQHYFKEMKVIDLAEQERVKREQEKIAKKEQEILDEIASQRDFKK